jgi:hypothetical protein
MTNASLFVSQLRVFFIEIRLSQKKGEVMWKAWQAFPTGLHDGRDIVYHHVHAALETCGPE